MSNEGSALVWSVEGIAGCETIYERLAQFSSKELMDALMAADATLFQNLTSGHLLCEGERP